MPTLNPQARLKRNEMLWARETSSRERWIDMLKAEEAALDTDMERWRRQYQKENIDAR